MIKTIQQTLILALCVLMPSIMKGAGRSADDAKEIAAEFFQSGDVARLSDKNAFVLVHTVVDDSADPICYVFNSKDGKGFAIVSADEGAMPVVGYSAEAAWDAQMIPGAARLMLASPIEMSADSRRKVAQKRASEVEARLLSTPSWSQEAPFNNNIPNHRLTGCVGVALAEILKFHAYPASRPASLVNAGESSAYAWSLMRDDNYRSGYSQEEADAVAAIVADAAIAIGTDFGQSSSSAYEVKVPHALVSLFGFDAGVSYKKRSEMNKADWDQVIVNEINEDRPVLYSGQDVSSGHAFVCDGYEIRGGVPYFHINWGWGGSANGYYASDALNPVVSKKHSYNDLMTVVYNIKPAADATAWSDIHVTSDERQPGLTVDVADIAAAGSFTLRAGALKNISNSDFSGKLAVALFDAAGKQKCLLSDGRNFSLVALQISKYADFSCKLPSGVSVVDSDVVRLVTQSAGSSEWLPVAGDLLAPGQAAAKNYAVPYFQVTLPGLTGDYAVTADATKVIKGRDYTFTVSPLSLDKVITVRANGFILTPDANNAYRLSNVLEDQNVDIIVQNAADVLSKSTLWVTAGNLHSLLSVEQAATVTDLTLFGTINADDFNFMRDRMKLSRLDISQASIAALGSNPANAIPTKAFTGYRSLKQIILPNNLTTLKNGCLAQTGLTSIEIPASVATWEYNVFVGCNQLREVTARRSSPAWVNWCVFSGVPQDKLIVPVGSAAAYKAKDYWKDFKEVVEENAVAPDHYNVYVSENRNIRFVAVSEGTEFAPGAVFTFSAEADDTLGDANLEVYANSERLYAAADGNYNARIAANTLIHFEFKQPIATTPDNSWKLTAASGGVGLVSEVVNVLPGKSFTVRANAISVPSGAESSKFYAMVLTDKDGGIKEFITPVYTSTSMNAGSQSMNFGCKVQDATVREGNFIRLATSYNKKDWQLVGADSDSVADRLAARGNQVVFHSVNMPQSITGAKIEGAVSQIVRGMPLSIKVTPVAPTNRVTLSVNGVNKAVGQAIVNLNIPSVKEDLDIAIQIHEADASDFVVVNVKEGELAAKIAECPERLKVVGTILVNEFEAFRSHATTIIDLDLSDLTVKGAMMTGNSIPESAFAPKNSTDRSALRTVVLPQNLERIDQNAFARCLLLEEITIPEKVSYIGSGAFSTCVGLKKIVSLRQTPPSLGSMTPFPSNASSITLVVPRGFEWDYEQAEYWKTLSIYKEEEPRDYYWIKYDPDRIIPMGNPGDLNNIGITATAGKEVYFFLPNIQNAAYTKNPKDNYRPGVVYKIYDNGFDILADYQKACTYPYPSQVSPYSDVTQGWSMDGGKICIKLLPSEPDHRFYKPQNHELALEFYYPVDFKLLDGADGVKAQMVGLQAGVEWKNVPMRWFDYKKYSSDDEKDVYREGSEIKFRLTPPSPNVQLTVSVTQKVMTQAGANRKYEERSMDLVPDGDGIYTIPELAGDAEVKISGTLMIVEGEPVPADALQAIDKDDVAEFTQLAVTGELGEEEFETIRENFANVETLDLSQIDNEVIPDGAFAGMEALNTVIIPETVTEIGAGAFAGCENIETITLPGVNSIGEGAFEGCSNLTSILIPNSDAAPVASDAPAAAPRKIARAGSGITAESFRGLSPNCLIYVGENEIPDSGSLNIILNKNGQRVAASDINLDGNHAFNAPASFLLGDHSISFTVDVTASDACDVDGGWSTIMLPFQPSDWKFGKEFGSREGSGLHLLSFDGEDAVALTPQSEFLPNRPYLANVCAPFSSVPVTFTAKARTQNSSEIVYDVPFTPVPEETVAVGKEFSLYGSYDGQTRPVAILALNEEGSRFASDADASVAPFSAYLVANEGVAKTEMAVGLHPLWIQEPASTGVSGTKLYRSGKIELASVSPKAEVYYTVDGSDPKNAQGSRRLFSEPFAMVGESMSIKAVAEYKGYVSDVVDLEFELKKASIDYSLAQNWNWISHNVENPVAVADFASDGIDGILSQTEETVFDSKHGFVGSLSELAPAAGYKVRVAGESWTGSLSGVAFDPAASVKLNKGWNWIGTPVDEGSLLIADLLSALEVEEGDMLVGLDGFVQADANGQWLGSVSHMVPGEGYMFFSNSDKEFTYTILPAGDKEEALKAPLAEACWTVDNHKYASVMPVVAELTFADGARADADDCLVAAFCGDECRGIGTEVNGMVMINVHGNSGDVISFRILDSLDEEKVSATSVAFSEDLTTTFAAPLAIDVETVSAVGALRADSFGISSENGSLLFSGDLSGVKSVEIFDIAGVMVKKAVKTDGGMIAEGLSKGVVTVVVRTEDGSFSRKIAVK